MKRPRERMPDISTTLGLRHTSNLDNGGELVLSGNAAYTDEFYNGSSSNHQALVPAYTLLTLRGEYWAPDGNWHGDRIVHELHGRRGRERRHGHGWPSRTAGRLHRRRRRGCGR